jgi:hypothetical protein
MDLNAKPPAWMPGILKAAAAMILPGCALIPEALRQAICHSLGAIPKLGYRVMLAIALAHEQISRAAPKAGLYMTGEHALL